MKDEIKRPEVPLFLIDNDKCINCAVPVCAKVCPVSAIYKSNAENNSCKIDNNRCVGCGDCLVYCPNNAVKFRESINQVKYFLDNYNTVALLDPSISGEFEDITDYRKFVAMIKSLGFDHVQEVSFGVDMVATKYADLINNYRGKYYIFSTCPVVVNYVRKFHPELIDNLAPFVSPSVALAKFLRNSYSKDTKFIFIGPCIASKDEEFYSEEKYIDANITFRELRKMFKDSDIQELKAEFDDFDMPHGNRGSMYPLINGLLYAAECENSPVFSMADRRKSLDAVKTFSTDINKLQKHFNLFYCKCCSLGPGTTGGNFILSDNAVRNYAKKRDEKLDKELWAEWLEKASHIDLKNTFAVDDQRSPEPPEEEVDAILEKIRHNTEGCQLCGYNSCRDFAAYVAKGHIGLDSCLFYNIETNQKAEQELKKENGTLKEENVKLRNSETQLKNKLSSLSLEKQQLGVLIDNLNTAVVIVDTSLNIVIANTVFINMLGEDAMEIADIVPGLVGASLRSLVPEQLSNLFYNVLTLDKTISNQDMSFNQKYYNVSIFPIEEGNMAGGIIRDMHSAEIQKEQIIKKINEVIDDNLSMVQQIGFLLGEGASQTEKKLNSVINTYNLTKK
jgi:Fe-S-cluster-containing hydrogenase component 2/PAS domain-containing protein